MKTLVTQLLTMHRIALRTAMMVTAVAALIYSSAQAQERKPNILVIFGDDIGQSNISVYTHGLVGYKTPNIDRIAREGMMFIDYYGENSCTAGRSSFITGQSVFRTGLSKVGAPGATVGLQKEDITIAEALKPLGYATGQFGKNHLGDRDEYLPTAHGFDEFFGNLYHLNAEEEPERPYYPKNDAAFVKGFSPRGVLHSFADGKTEDTGPLNRTRMETIDDETTKAAIDFMERQVKAGKPFFVWMNTTRMHVFTHVRPEYVGKAACPATNMPTACGNTIRTWVCSSRRWTTLGSPTTRSSSTPPTTAPTCFRSPMPRCRRSGARRTPTGKARSGCRR